MKPWAILLTAVLLLLLALYSGWYLDRTANNLLAVLGDLRYSLEEENWALAESKAAAAEKEWERIVSCWQIFINHQEIDNIEQSLVRLKEFAAAREKADSLNELAVLMKSIGHIPETSVLTIGNIF